jgi:hypothetical protein
LSSVPGGEPAASPAAPTVREFIFGTTRRAVSNHRVPYTSTWRAAPVIARHKIDINARLETVWRLQTNVNDWPA